MATALVILLCSLLQNNEANAQQTESLTAPVSASGAVLGIDQLQRLEIVQGKPWAEEVAVSVSTRVQEVLRLHRFAIELPSGRRVEARTRGVTPHADGSISWTGTVGGSESLTSIIADETGLVGSIRDGDRTFVFEPLGDDATAIYQVRYDQLPPDHPSGERPNTAAAPVAEKSASASSGGSAIDILFVYTPAAASGIASIVHAAETDLNAAHANSNAASTGTVVHHEVITYTETGSFALDLSRLVGTSDGYLDSVHSLRDNVGADVVVLIVNSGNACGLAGGFGVGPADAFAVVKKSCIVSKYSFAHELGHLVGARHQRASGPFELGWHESAVLTASAFWDDPEDENGGPCENCTYQWYERPPGGSWYYTGITSTNYYTTMLWTQGREYRVDATSGSMQDSDTHFIDYCASPCGPPAKRGDATGDADAIVDLYPNPSGSTATLRFVTSSTGDVVIRVFDLLGRVVKMIPYESRLPGDQSVDVDLKGLVPGVYQVVIATEQTQVARALVRY